MTKWGAVGTASLNISTVYVCLACSSSSASESQNVPANSNVKTSKHERKCVQVSAEAMVNLGWRTVSLLVQKERVSNKTRPLLQPHFARIRSADLVHQFQHANALHLARYMTRAKFNLKRNVCRNS